ncbi:hypothetical protein LINGRAHAP2_LOCUS20299 [Linum grandiflorum]
MDLATSEELVGAIQDWPHSRYSDTEIESRRTTIWWYLVGEREPCIVSTAPSHRITIPLYRFLHILFNGTISVYTDDNRDLVTTTEIDLFWAIAEKSEALSRIHCNEAAPAGRYTKIHKSWTLNHTFGAELRLLGSVCRYAQTNVVWVRRVACSGQKLRTKGTILTPLSTLLPCKGAGGRAQMQ